MRDRENRIRANSNRTTEAGEGPDAVGREASAQLQAAHNRKARDELDAILRTLPDCVKVSDANHRLLSVNPAGVRLIGADGEEEALGRSLLDLVTPEHRSRFRKHMEEARSGETGPIQVEMMDLKGQLHWIECIATPLPWSPPAVLSVSRDVTEQKRLSDALRESRRVAALHLDELELLYRTAPVGLALLDQDLRLLRLNDRLAAVTGSPACEQVGRTLWELLPDHAARIGELCRTVFETGTQVLNVEFAGPFPGRAELDEAWLANYYPLKNSDGSVTAVAAVLVDVTAWRRAQRLRLDLIQREKNAFAELAAANEREARVLDSVSDAVLAFDKQWRVEYANPQAGRLMGRNPDDLIGKAFFSEFPNAKDSDFHKAWEQAVVEQRPVTLEAVYAPVDRWFSSTVYPSPQGVTVYFQDIHRRKRAEFELRGSEERLRAALDAAEMGSWDWDLRTDKLVWSRGHVRLWGMDPDRSGLRFEDFEERVHPEDREALLEAISKARRRREVYEHEFRVVWSDGSVHWILGRGRFEYDADGEAYRMRGLVKEVTKRKEAEAAVARSEARFRTIAQLSPTGIFLWDADGMATYANPALLRISGRNPEELAGTAWFEAIHPDDRDRLQANWAEAIANGRPYKHTGRCLQPDGTVVWFEAETAPFYIDGELVGHVGAVSDITARVQREAELEREVSLRTQSLRENNIDLEAFAQTVSHDLRSPLRAIAGFADLLLDDYANLLGKQAEDYLRLIIGATERMDLLICDVMAYSGLGKGGLKSEPVSSAEAVAAAIKELEQPIAASRADVRVVGELPGVLAHKRTLVAVFNNLISNAIRFVKPGEPPRVRIRAEANGASVRIWVEDGGIGIRPEDQERIFHPFERLHGIETYPGNGIGLAIVRRALQKMGGGCGVKSEPGLGARFWFDLPAGGDANPKSTFDAQAG